MENHSDKTLGSDDSVAEFTKIGLWELNLKTNIVTYNKAFLELIGYQTSELHGTKEEWESFYHPEDAIIISKKAKKILSGEINEISCEARLRHKKGHYTWGVNSCFVSGKDENDQPTKIMGSYVCIDKAKLIEEKIKAGLERIEQAERNVKEMFEASPHAAVMFDDHFRLIDANPAAIKFYGFKDREVFLNNAMKIIQSAIPDVQISGDRSISLADRMKFTVEQGYHEFNTTLVLNNEKTPLNIIFKKIKYQDSFLIVGYQYELGALKKVQKDLEKQDRLLRAVNEVSQILLAADLTSFSGELWKSLDILGKNAEVDRVYIWENHEIEGKLYCTQTCEWSLGAEPQQGNELTIDMPYDDVIPNWKTTLKVGKSMNAIVKNLSEAERNQLEPQGILSILIAPIFVRDEFWGFIGFDDCNKERVFSATEENTLRSAGLLITSAMLRNEIHKSLLLAKDEATRNANVKSQFLANMSHEIRTPMNAVIGMTNIAIVSESIERKDDCLQKILSASRHLLNVINDILDMSKIDANKFELSNNEFDLLTALDEVYSITLNQALEKHQEYKIEIDEKVPQLIIGDELRIMQVVTNLLSNAVKFTPEYGRITLKVEHLSENEKDVELKFIVEDNGIGIPKDKISALFNAFEQLDLRVTKKYGGTGLGLAICKRIVALMDGNIEVESEIGRGSTFSFIITTKKGIRVNKVNKEKHIANKDDFAGKTILLAEDIEINREIVVSLLEPTNVQVDCAENGEIALKMFEDNMEKYDLIFMDIHMPVMDGYEATKRIRSLPNIKAKTIPIIAMTANAFAEDVKKCLEVEMNDHIAKPIDFEEVLVKLNKYLP